MGERGPNPNTDRLYKRGRIWWCWYYDADGSRIRRSTATTDKKTARVRLAGWERAAADPSAQEPQTLNDCLQVLLDERRASTTDGNVRYLEGKVTPLVTVLGHELPIGNIRDTTTGRDYIAQRRKVTDGTEPPLDRTIERELEVLVMGLRLAKGHRRWSGDAENIIPPDFKPAGASKGDSLTRREALKVFPKLGRNAAAAMAYALATGAEKAALDNARREDIPQDLDRCEELLVRGTKNDARFERVPIVTDEQRRLLAYARQHAQGVDGQLFAPLYNYWRDLHDACALAGVTTVSSQDLRRSAGQWMVDIGVPLEIVSKFMRHKDITTTQRWYAEIRDADVAAAHKARKKKKGVEVIQRVPPPKDGYAVYEVDGVEKTLDAWAVASGIPKTTLYYRVVTTEMPMPEALALGRAKYTPRRTALKPREGCDTGVTVSADSPPGIGAIPVPAAGAIVKRLLKSRETQCARTDSNGRLSASKADALSS